MSSDICVFKRIEKKYRLTTGQMDKLLELISSRLVEDAHGQSTICSLYLDTPDHLLIRNSIDAKSYKEKLRIRSYGVPAPDQKIFLEMKKKYKGVVYKRRLSIPYSQAVDYIKTGNKPLESQIMEEIDYSMKFYNRPQPSMFIAYERDAFYAKDDQNLRITFDSNVRYRTDDLSLAQGTHGKKILPENARLMEIKTDGAMPLWLAEALDQCNILPSSFSKYGTAYRLFLRGEEAPRYTRTKGGLKNVSNF